MAHLSSVLLSVLMIHTATALMGYDCRNLTKISRIALNQVAPCPDENSNPYASRTTNAAVIQRKEVSSIPVTTCKLTYLQSIVRCGMHSHGSSTTNGVTEGDQRISREECINAAKLGILHLHSKTISGIKINSTTRTSVVIAGTKSPTGACNGADFEYRGTTYQFVVVEREYKITITEYIATMDRSSALILLQGGVTCRYTDLACHDDEEGHSFWSPAPTESCEISDFHTIFEGPMDIVERPSASSSSPITYAIVNTPNHLFALKLLSNVTACSHPVTQTEHPQLLVMFLHHQPSPFPKTTEPILDLIKYVNSKFLYTELRLAERSSNLSSYVVQRRCETERQTLLHKLALAREQPELVAHIFDIPGITGRTIGEVLYLGHCKQTMVELRRTEFCYDALAVTDVHNTSLFLTPITKILTETAEPIPCDTLLPPLHQINHQWFEFSPLPSKTTSPQILSPDSTSAVRFEVMDFISEAGLYTADEMKKFSRLLAFPATRTAISNSIARAAAGEELTDFQLSPNNLFPYDHAKVLVQHAIERLWGWFSTIGQFAASIFGIIFIFRVIKFLLTTMFNVLALREVTGCSFLLLAGFWTAATHFFIRRTDERRRRAEDVEAFLMPRPAPSTQQPPETPAPSAPLADEPPPVYDSNMQLAHAVNQCPTH